MVPISLQELKGYAIGVMKMSEDELGIMRLGLFFLKLHFFVKEKNEHKKFIAELVRQQTYFLVNIQLSPKNKIAKPGDLWKMPWDEETEVEIDYSKASEDIQKMEQILHNSINNGKGNS